MSVKKWAYENTQNSPYDPNHSAFTYILCAFTGSNVVSKNVDLPFADAWRVQCPCPSLNPRIVT